MSVYERRVAEALEKIAETWGTPENLDPVPSGTAVCDHEWATKGIGPTTCVKCNLVATADEWPETAEDAIKILNEGLAGYEPPTTPVPFGEPSLDLAVSLPGEQVAVAVLDLFKMFWSDMTPDQKQVWLDWMIEDQKAWRKFWKVGE